METLSQHSSREEEATKDIVQDHSVSSRMLYVYPTSERLHEEHLKEIFGLFGSINELKCVKEERYGSVVFASEEDAMKASTVMDGGVIDGKNVSVTFSRDFEKYREKMRRNRYRQASRETFQGRRGRVISNLERKGVESKPRNRVESRDSRKSPTRGRFERERRYEETRKREQYNPSPSRERRNLSNDGEDKTHRSTTSYAKRRRTSSDDSSYSSHHSRHSRKHSSRKKSHKRLHHSSSSNNSLRR